MFAKIVKLAKRCVSFLFVSRRKGKLVGGESFVVFGSTGRAAARS